MRRRFPTTAACLAVSLALLGCSSTPSNTSDSDQSEVTQEETVTTPSSTTQSDITFVTNDTDMFTNRDCDASYDASESISIILNGDSISCSSDAVTISGTTITLTEEATYLFSGTLNDGSIIVDAQDTAKLQLVLNNAAIHSETSAPLYIKEADKVFVTLPDGTENTLTNGGSFSSEEETNMDGAIFSRQDLTFNGNGALVITSPAGHGIVCKDDLVFTGGSIQIESASHALDANDSVRITAATITAIAGKDGIHAENSEDSSLGYIYIADGTLHIESEGDGISANSFLQINDGNLTITAGGGSVNGSTTSSDSYGNFMGGGMGGHRGHSNDTQTPTYKQQSTASSDMPTADSNATETTDASTSMKGLKSAASILLAGGTIQIDSADDAIHAEVSITVSGGTFQLATGDDGIHASETLLIQDGTIEVSESYEGLEALDIEVAGGTIRLVCTDDGLNAAGGTDNSGSGGRDGMNFGGGMGGDPFSSSSDGSILISGGTLQIQSSGDGIDANGTLTITGGYTTVCGPIQGDTATLDYDISAVITGGTFIGTGASSMAQTFSDSEQGVIAVSVGSQAEGTVITLTDSSGATILTHEPELSYGVVILSSPDIKKGEVYTIQVGSASGEFEAS